MFDKVLRFLPPTEKVIHSGIPQKFSGITLLEYLCRRFPFYDQQKWVNHLSLQQTSLNGTLAHGQEMLQAGDKLVNIMPPSPEPPINPILATLYEDEDIWVINKGAPLPVHPSGTYYLNSLTEILKQKYPQQKFHLIHRLDSLTTGVLILGKNVKAATFFMKRFQNHLIQKTYLAMVEGEIRNQEMILDSPIGSSGSTLRFAGSDTIDAQTATTKIELLNYQHGKSLLKVTPLTGRTNQIRVHLSHAGFPIVNDPIYGRGKKPAWWMGLHCWQMQTLLPNGKEIIFKADPPEHLR